MATSDIWTRSRGDMAADNRRLYDVAARAAALVDRYSWTDDVQRHFGAEPVALAMPFGLMDLQNDWRALFESLIVAGIIEPDHLGLPAEAGDAVFLRIQEYRAAGDYWYTCGQFEVVPGALSYAQCDAAAVEIYYRDPARAVRVVRDVLPVAARAEYLGGDRTRVNHSAVLGMIQGGSVVELSTGYAVIGDASANPDGAVLGSAFWPARIVLQGVPGPKGDPGTAGGVQVVGATFGARVGGTGGAWAEIAPYVEGVGYRLTEHGPLDAGQPQDFQTVSGAIAAAVLWLASVAADGRLYFARFDGDVGSWELECFEGGCTLLNGEVTGYGVPVVNASGLHFTSVGLAGAAGDAWINAGAAGGGTDGYTFTVDPVAPGVGAVLHLFIDGVETQANTGMNFVTVGAAILAGLKWLHDRGADVAVWWADYDPSQEGPDKWVIYTYENGVTVDGNGEVVTPGVEAPDFGGNVFDLSDAGDYVQPFLDENINAGFGPVPEWVQAIDGFDLVQFGRPVWPDLPGYPGGDWVSVAVQLPDGSFVADGLNMRKVLGFLPSDPAGAVIAAVSMAGAAGVYGVVDHFSGELVATFSPNGPRAWAWAAAEGGGWVLVDSTGQGAGVSGGARYWVKGWHGFRGEWIKAHAVGVGVEVSDSLMQVSATVITPGVGAGVYEARPALLATDGDTVFPEMPWAANGSTWANVTGVYWAQLDHPEWGDGSAETDESTAWAAAWYVAERNYQSSPGVLRVFPQWEPEIPA